MDSKTLQQIDRILLTKLWEPLSEPQQAAVDSEADILGYGGAAGGGKTDLMVGLGLTEHKRSIIFRREGTQLLAVKDRIAEIRGSYDEWNGQDQRWTIGKRRIELAGVRDLGTEKKYQGRAHDLKCFDEVTEMAEAQVRFLMGWLRSSNKDQRCRIVMGFNPPTTEEGRWVINFFAPWLDENHPDPAKPGELRWFTTIEGKDVECDGPDPVEVDGDMVKPLSRTFIPSRVEDNVFYMESGYKAVLQALPEPLRSQMLKGDFNAGVGDDPWQVIPTSWVQAAQDRWEDKHDGPMDSLGCDPARGGDDRTVIMSRYGTWFSEPEVYPGAATPNGPTVAGLCVAAARNGAPIHVDVIGVGGSVVDHLEGLNVQVEAVNFAKKTDETDKSKQLRMGNIRAWAYWHLREMLDPDNGEEIQLPPDDELRRELCSPKFHVKPSGIYVESKEDLIARLGKSPDKADACVLAGLVTAKKDDLLDLFAGETPRESGSWMG